MVDFKALLAVFATLAFAAVMMNSGQMESQNVDSFQPSEIVSELKNLNSRPLGAFTRFLGDSESDTYVEGVLKVENPQKQDLEFRSSLLDIRGFREITVDKRTVSSDEDIVLQQFDGKISFQKDDMKLEGRSEGFISSGINISGGLELKESMKKDRINALGVEKADISLDSVTGRISSNDTSAEFTDSMKDMRMYGFEGNFTFHADNGTFRFEGEVASLNAGSVSFGG